MVRKQDPDRNSKNKDTGKVKEIDKTTTSTGSSKVEKPTEDVDTGKADQLEEDPFEPLVEQLESLRSLLIKSAVTFVLWFLIVFATVRWWFPVVSMGADMVVFGPFEVIRFYIRTSAAMSLGLSIPFICWFLWQYVSSGMIEKKNPQLLKGSMGFMFGLFLVGIAFGYFVVHPLSYFFLIQMGERNFDVLVTADEYMSFLLITTIPFGLIFQLPLIVLFLNHIEVLDSTLMKKSRKFAYFGLLVLTAIIAPPDFFTHIITLLPMIGLYEFSIILVRRKEKRADKKKEPEA
ncbi:twin-arginine translocase subunit TatC [Salinicoccus sesuvii]|uniref:Sec-independent protein translocase protein TatC n=1 Tax=Salinicoccus sesuvii TaxID=868281 RepID=A0ABV7N6G0_9STAP